MPGNRLPLGSFVQITKPDLQQVVDGLKGLGYRTLGPQVADHAIVYEDLDRVEDLPRGIIESQDGGRYRLCEDPMAGWFDYVVGPQSLKRHLFPPRETVLTCHREGETWDFHTPEEESPPLAVIGPRACDVAALRIQDRVFLEGDYVDSRYKVRRQKLFVLAVNCRRAAATCFCHSVQSGPVVGPDCDLALTELDDLFVLQVITERGSEALADVDWSPCSLQDIQAAKRLSEQLEQQMQSRGHAEEQTAAEPNPGRTLETQGLHDALLDNLEHPRWEDVAQRCLACGNCTLVCPTCFCSSVEEMSDLTNHEVRRERIWTSCFTAEHSYMNSGTVHKSTKSRYRQWLTHKLATWQDQFGELGCTGCGRCIVWCPVGIDLTAEVAAIRSKPSRNVSN